MKHSNSHQTSTDSLKQNLEKYSSWIEYYSKGLGINIKFDEKIPAPACMQDNSKTISVNHKMIKEEMNFSEEQILMTIFHEIEHIKESSQLTKVEISKKQSFTQKEGKKYHTLENITRDIYVNNQVISNLPTFKEEMGKFYEDKLFQEKDYLKMPEHLQFLYAILRESFVDEECKVTPKVRNIINAIKKTGLLEKATNGAFKNRLEHIQGTLYKIYKSLYKKDLEKKQEEQNNNQKDNEQQGEESQEGESQGSQNPEQKEEKQGNSEKDKNTKKSLKDKIKEILGKNKPKEQTENNTEKNPQNDKKESPKENTQENQEANKSTDPFEEEYNNIPSGIPHILEDSISKADYGNLKETIQKSISKKDLTKEDLERLKRAEKILGNQSGNQNEEIEKIAKTLEEYDTYKKETLDTIIDSDTGENIMEEIYKIFEKIAARRQKETYKIKRGVNIESGTRLDASRLAEGVSEIKGGNYDPEMFETDIKKAKEQDYIGRFDLSVIADGSGSMQGGADEDQKKATLTILESLKLLHDKLQDELEYCESKLDFTTEALMFGRNPITVLKEESTDFSDKDRLNTFENLDICQGGTNDYDGIEYIYKQIQRKSSEYKEELQNGKTKKIVIVMTDGDSWNPEMLKNQIEKLRKQGAIVYGIGMTSSGIAVKKVYKSSDEKQGNGTVCYDTKDLAKVLKDVLKPHLNEL